MSTLEDILQEAIHFPSKEEPAKRLAKVAEMHSALIVSFSEAAGREPRFTKK